MKKSILLVDDKPEIAKIIMLYLSAYDVKYVENPLIAIAWLSSGNYISPQKNRAVKNKSYFYNCYGKEEEYYIENQG